MKLDRKFLCATAAAGFMAMLAPVPASAKEMWDLYLRAVNVGTPAGALPPPGVYGSLNTYFAAFSKYDVQGNKIPNTALDLGVIAPTVLWVPGIRIFDATYAMAVSQAFDYTSFQGQQRVTGHSGPGNLGIYNTLLMPVILSWKLPEHIFLRTGLSIYLPDATNTIVSLNKGDLKNGGLPSGNSFTTIEPDVGISWLYNGWNVSVGTRYGFAVDSTNIPSYHGYSYYTAPEFSADYTITKTISHWTFGLGGSQQVQFSKDTCHCTVAGIGYVHGAVPGSIVHNYTIGPVFGYQFTGGMNFTMFWNHGFASSSDIEGDIFDFRLTQKF